MAKLPAIDPQSDPAASRVDTTRNPFAPPVADVADVAAVGAPSSASCTRDGKFVMLRAGGDLPPRCIVCNAPARLPIKVKKLYWHSPWLYLLFLINFIVYLVVAMIVRKSVKVSPGLCPVHGTAYNRRTWLAGLTCVGGIMLGAVATASDQPGFGALLFVASFVALIVWVVVARKVHARGITKEFSRLGGCKEPFLQSLG